MTFNGLRVLVIDDEADYLIPKLRQVWSHLREREPAAPDAEWIPQTTPQGGIDYLGSPFGGAVSVVVLDYHFPEEPEREPHARVLNWLYEHPEAPGVVMFTRETDAAVFQELTGEVETLRERAARPWRKSALEHPEKCLLFARELLLRARARKGKLDQPAPEGPQPGDLVLDFTPHGGPNIYVEGTGEPPPDCLDEARRLKGRLARIAELLLRLNAVDPELCREWYPNLFGMDGDWTSPTKDITAAIRILRKFLGASCIPRASGGVTTLHVERVQNRFWCNVSQGESCFLQAWQGFQSWGRGEPSPQESALVRGCLRKAIDLDWRHIDAQVLAAAVEARLGGSQMEQNSSLMQSAKQAARGSKEAMEFLRAHQGHIQEAARRLLNPAELTARFRGTHRAIAPSPGRAPTQAAPGRCAGKPRAKPRVTGAAGCTKTLDERLARYSRPELLLLIDALASREGCSIKELIDREDPEWIVEQLRTVHPETQEDWTALLSRMTAAPEPIGFDELCRRLGVPAPRATTRRKRGRC